MKLSALVAAGFTAAVLTGPANTQEYVSLLVGSEGGTMYRLGAALTEVFNSEHDDYRLNMTIGGGAANPARLGAGDGDLGFSFSNFALSAYDGKEPFDQEFTDLRQVGAFWGACYHQYIGRDLYDAGIKSWDNIIASEEPLAMSGGSPTSSTRALNNIVLEAYGTSFEELEERGFKIAYTGTSGTAQQIVSGQLDIWFHNTGDPSGAGVEAALSRDLTFMDLSEKAKNALMEAGFRPCTIPGGIYENVDEDHESMGALGVMMAHKDTDPELVYQLLKTVQNNIETLGNSQKIFSTWTPEYGAADYGLPLHPGAERFYKEAGAL